MKKGDIVLVRFPFTESYHKKLRPACVIVEKSRLGDFILAFITTKLNQKEEHDLTLSQDHQDFQKTGLKKESILKLNKITALNKKLIVGKIGKLSDELIKKLDDRLKILFKLNQ